MISIQIDSLNAGLESVLMGTTDADDRSIAKNYIVVLATKAVRQHVLEEIRDFIDIALMKVHSELVEA